MRPCALCTVLIYTLMVGILFYENYDHGGLFDSLRLNPKLLEFNLLLRSKYDLSLGFRRNDFSSALVLCPLEDFGNFMRAFFRYLMEPSYGKIFLE